MAQLEEKAQLVELDADEGKFCVNVTLCVKSERREEFLRCIAANAAGTMGSEPAALLYQWGESTTTPNTFHLQEAYVGKTGFEAHTATAHFVAWEKFAGTDPFTAEPEVQQFSAIHVHVPKDCEFM